MNIELGLCIGLAILFFYFVNKYEKKVKQLEEEIRKNRENINHNKENIVKNTEKIEKKYLELNDYILTKLK